MQSHHADFYNKNYKIYKLRDKLVKHFKFIINFWQRYPTTSDLVHSHEIPTEQAVVMAFENATLAERTVKAAMVIRRAVLDGCNDSQQLPRPPADKDLRTEIIQLPQLLITVLSLFLYSKNRKPQSTRCQRRVVCAGQDICVNVTKGKWKMPKHILIGICVRHLTGKTKLNNILNRHGH
ncbi:hypothetical protein PoB_007215900 [Plakobranchus ocellatus]|uniref:Uncharacterized protein n=1 Tax=Plakobranchus ocellatus TaxID=259542 RepID=A0AAV4DN90_9GAST|nr:hypothetical protein PoB_007215900 [Plakobranchus ocellatus]